MAMSLLQLVYTQEAESLLQPVYFLYNHMSRVYKLDCYILCTRFFYLERSRIIFYFMTFFFGTTWIFITQVLVLVVVGIDAMFFKVNYKVNMVMAFIMSFPYYDIFNNYTYLDCDKLYLLIKSKKLKKWFIL
jgi:hypothetical protein